MLRRVRHTRLINAEEHSQMRNPSYFSLKANLWQIGSSRYSHSILPVGFNFVCNVDFKVWAYFHASFAVCIGIQFIIKLTVAMPVIARPTTVPCCHGHSQMINPPPILKELGHAVRTCSSLALTVRYVAMTSTAVPSKQRRTIIPVLQGAVENPWRLRPVGIKKQCRASYTDL